MRGIKLLFNLLPILYSSYAVFEITKKELKCVAPARYTNFPAFRASFLVSD